jgi:hypothetical protein
MPGAYAMSMQQILAAGRWPDELLTTMLYHDTLHANHPNAAMNTFIVDPNLPSCHPSAIRFMNVLNPGLFPGDDVFGLGDGKVGGPAAGDVLAGQAAVQLNDRAVWVRYGGANGHSFVLLTGHAPALESFEAWAGGGGGYFFHWSVCNEPDDLGHPRVVNGRLALTRLAAVAALGNLLDPSHLVRGAAVNLMSRAGAGGFGGHALGLAVPGLDIHVTVSQGLVGFANTVRTRLRAVGFYRAQVIEHMQGGRVCCHCQVRVATQALAHTGRWRECATCNRHYCRQCKHLLASQPRPTLLHTRVRICDCGGNTART